MLNQSQQTPVMLLAVTAVLSGLNSSAASPTPATMPLVQITWDTLSCGPTAPRPCEACSGGGGNHEQAAMNIYLHICCGSRGEEGYWLLDPVFESDVGTTYVVDPSTVRAFAELLGDGTEQKLTLIHDMPGAGSSGIGVDEGFLFAGVDVPLIQSEVFVSPVNGLDYQGFAIDAIENHLAALCVDYNPDDGHTWYGVTVVTTIHGRRGDLDSDNQIGMTDLALLLAEWGPCPAPPEICLSDLNRDGTTGINDLLVLLGNWG